MTETNAPLREARALPKDAKFYRCAFQVNPASYAAKFRGNGHGLDERTYVQKLLDKCVELDIEVIAVTDHNDAGSIALFREEAKPRNITVFPGFEVASSEGVHVLCIYPLDATKAALDRYLGEIGITTTEPSSSLSKKSFADLLECVRTQGGLTIAAHITQEKGLLNTLHGQARVQAWRDSNLLCVQIPGSVEEAADDKRPILKNQNADYKREVGPDATTALAIVNAGDVAKSEALDLATSTCWVKMTEPSLEGLRQAFLWLDRTLPLAARFPKGSIFREDRQPVPAEALRETIINAVIHRDLSLASGYVAIAVFDDRIEVRSVGELPFGLRAEQLSEEHPSKPRNPDLAGAFHRTGAIEVWGRGTNRVIEACRAWGIDVPTFKVEMGVTTVTFHAEIRPGREAEQAGTKPSHGIDLVGDSVGDPVDRLLGALERGPLATAQLQKALGLKHRPTFKENYLKPALAERLIEMTVPDKPSSRLQKYRLTDAGRARLSTKRGGAP